MRSLMTGGRETCCINRLSLFVGLCVPASEKAGMEYQGISEMPVSSFSSGGMAT
jgi:hypothetical protein